MSEFVEECRREWRRLRVPDPIANEMAADLAADLAEAEADGASPEQVLGSGAFDPRAFAASWAIERGIVAPAPPPRPTATVPIRYVPVRRPRPSAAVAVLAALALLATLAVAVGLISSRSGSSSKAAFASPALRILPGPAAGAVPDPDGRLILPPGGDNPRSIAIPAIGLLVLVVGLGGLALWVLYFHWSPWAGAGPGWRRRWSPFDDGAG
jgi:hypothetical protein